MGIGKVNLGLMRSFQLFTSWLRRGETYAKAFICRRYSTYLRKVFTLPELRARESSIHEREQKNDQFVLWEIQSYI